MTSQRKLDQGLASGWTNIVIDLQDTGQDHNELKIWTKSVKNPNKMNEQSILPLISGWIETRRPRSSAEATPRQRNKIWNLGSYLLNYVVKQVCAG